MSEPVTHKFDYTELTRMYNEAGRASEHCSHTDFSLTMDEFGVYTLFCRQCNLWGQANAESAKRLGWIE